MSSIKKLMELSAPLAQLIRDEYWANAKITVTRDAVFVTSEEEIYTEHFDLEATKPEVR